MAISSSYVVTIDGGTVSTTRTQKRKAIAFAHAVARQTPGRRVNVRTADGELIYQCHAQEEGGRRVRIITEEL